MNDLARTQASMPPPPASPTLTRAVDVTTSGAVTVNGEIRLLPGKGLAPEERRMAEARLSILSQSLAASASQVVASTVSRLLGGFPAIRDSGDNARALLASYVVMVEEFPIWAIDRAFKDWAESTRRQGRSLAYPPSAAELRDASQRVVSRPLAERAKLTQALTSKPYEPTAADRAAVVARHAADVAAMRTSVVGTKREPSPEESRAALERRCADLGIDPSAIDAVPSPKVTARPIGDLAATVIRP